ncbi:MAG: hypothetical protein ACYCOU_20520, partial [Sulfobacillus sp.]
PHRLGGSLCPPAIFFHIYPISYLMHRSHEDKASDVIKGKRLPERVLVARQRLLRGGGKL